MAIPALPPAATPVATPKPPAGQSLAAKQHAAKEFEAQALGALLQPMFEGLGTNGPFGGGGGEAQWRPMLVTEYGRVIARAGGVGLADAVLKAMLQIQGE